MQKTLAQLCAFLLLSSPLLAERVSLAGTWKFAPDPSGRLNLEQLSSLTDWRDIPVPGNWHSHFNDLRDYGGYAWYQRDFVLPPSRSDTGRVRLVFQASDYYTEVYLNGELLGSHEGAYLPFDFDITNRVRPTNRLQVRVLDPAIESGDKLPFLYAEIPHGKQDWYVQTSGLWQNVYLETRPDPFLERVRITVADRGTAEVAISLGGTRLAGASGHLRVLGPDNRTVISSALGWNSGRTFTQTIQVPDAQPWSPEAPSLYRLQIEIGTGDRKDTMEEVFGFRTLEARQGKLFLNGKPYFIIGALDQDFYPETIYTPPSRAYVRDQFLKAKQLGLNTLRCHIKVPDPVYYEVADEVGLLIWTDVPNFDRLTEGSKKRLVDTFKGMLERDWNHPSLAILTIFNEAWGIDLGDAAQREFLKKVFAELKPEVRGRLLVDNSPCCDNFHLSSDLNDFHHYSAIPDNHVDFDRWVADFATGPRWTYSPYGDAERAGLEPLVVSEFGNWGLPRIDGKPRWWFDRAFRPNRPATRPAGVLERFEQSKLNRLFRSYNDLAEATQTHQFQSLQHEIQAIRSHSSIQGYIITEFTDLNWEANGLLDMERRLKNYSRSLSNIQKQNILLPRLERFNYWAGEPIVFDLLFSQFAHLELKSLRLEVIVQGFERSPVRWDSTLDGTAGTKNVGIFRARAPDVNAPRPVRLLLRASDPSGKVVAENFVDVYVFPRPSRASARLHVIDGGNSLRAEMRSRGYELADNPADADLVVAWTWNDLVSRHVASGGKTLVLVERVEALPQGLPLQAATRQSDQLDGNWLTSFIWAAVDRDPFSAVPLQKVLGFEADAVLPRLVLKGVQPEQFGAAHSGIFAGWIHLGRALAVEVRTPSGRAYVTTFRFNDSYGRDPYATHLLDAMIQHTLGGSFDSAIAVASVL